MHAGDSPPVCLCRNGELRLGNPANRRCALYENPRVRKRGLDKRPVQQNHRLHLRERERLRAFGGENHARHPADGWPLPNRAIRLERNHFAGPIAAYITRITHVCENAKSRMCVGHFTYVTLPTHICSRKETGSMRRNAPKLSFHI